jgi:hypothetical protein
MENNILDTIWDQQNVSVPVFQSKDLIRKAITQRRNQKIGMVVMCTTVVLLIMYAIWQFPEEINRFIVGLFIMIASLLIRIAIEYYSKLRKVSGMIHMDARQYIKYLKSYYNWRKRIHYIITPLCFSGYLLGLWQLFPYFKAAFSDGFYKYLVISGTVSLFIIAIIIIHQVRKEMRFIEELKA